jgi:hypothetical protein
MNDQGKKEDSWVRKLPTIIVALSVLIFGIVVFTNHNQYKKWKAEQSEKGGNPEAASGQHDSCT